MVTGEPPRGHAEHQTSTAWGTQHSALGPSTNSMSNGICWTPNQSPAIVDDGTGTETPPNTEHLEGGTGHIGYPRPAFRWPVPGLARSSCFVPEVIGPWVAHHAAPVFHHNQFEAILGTVQGAVNKCKPSATPPSPRLDHAHKHRASQLLACPSKLCTSHDRPSRFTTAIRGQVLQADVRACRKDRSDSIIHE